MKAVAVIGSSSAIMKDSYGAKMKTYFKEECDIYGLGGSTSIFAIYTLLKHDIIGHYKTVIIQTNIIETGGCYYNYLNPYVVITNILFILKLFSGSNSVPLFLLLPCGNIPYYLSSSNIYIALSKLFSFSILDIERILLCPYKNKFMPDGIHFNNTIQELIFNRLLDTIPRCKRICSPHIPSNLSFSIKPISELVPDLKLTKTGTSLLQMDVGKCLQNEPIPLPKDLFLCGIIYFTEGGPNYARIKNDSVDIVSGLYIKNWEKGFFSSYLGHSVPAGIKGGQISICNDVDGKIEELSWPRSNGT